MTHLELNDVQAETLIRELFQIIDGDRYPLGPRIVALKEILLPFAAPVGPSLVGRSMHPGVVGNEAFCT
jgi:hypothetical protein